MIRRCDAIVGGVILLCLAVQLVFGDTTLTKSHCDDSWSDCAGYGEDYCEQESGCDASCYNCAGPGGLPPKICYKHDFETCHANEMDCGAKTGGICSDPYLFQDCYCDGNGTDLGECTMYNCG